MAKQFLTRRQILAMGGAVLAAPLVPPAAFALGSTNLGTKSLTILSDGNLMLPLDFAFPDVEKSALIALLEQSGQPTDALSPDCNVTLLRDGDRVVLFDVGAGPNFMPSAGKIAASLDEAGIQPSDVTDVIFTHAHPDHIWGLIDDFDELIFSEAQYHINRIEWDYWRNDNTLANTPDARKSFVVGAQSRLAYLEERISLFGYGDEVIAGIEAVNTAGHTPGHTSFAVHDGSESVLILGDAVTNLAISFQHPEWPSGSDHDAEMGLKTRASLLDRLATDKMGVVGFHLPHPGLGQVEREGAAYRYVAKA